LPIYFTLHQAEKLLPDVEFTIREAIAHKADYQQAEEEWQGFATRITMLGGVRVDYSQIMDQKRRRESSALRLKEAIEKIQEYGCVVKDLDIGLIDFPTLYTSEEVYLR